MLGLLHGLLCLSLAYSAVSLPPRPAQLPFSPSSHPHQRPPPRGEHRMEPGYNPYPGGKEAAELRMPSGFSRNIPERRIHSHNDYWRDVPVYTALSHGALSIEADVWLNPKDDKLYVSHNVASLTRARTFSRLYIDQLVDLLSRANVHEEETAFFDETDYWTMENEREERRPWTSFYEGNLTPIQLLVDLKTRGNETYHAVLRELEPLRSRGWLTTRNGTHVEPGPVSVLLTGNGINLDVRSQVAPQTSRDVFLDAPLLRLDETWQGIDGEQYGWNSTLAPMASASFASATSWDGRRAIATTEETALSQLLQTAQKRGFKTRLWSTPRWPTHVRDRVWRTLYDLGTDWLDADDIEAAAAF
ncbi:hypothetical protein NBRC10513_003532 [Rhodotorula toruloides]|uniref:Altered inheritance of mitochondria protein 6 n=1 Tax=Rhodotorula toruloides TaxID=5286 RepID=A0A0K3C3H5_RHOTO|nr:hypothetical protein AAT19DRAFT_8373 [Rhodotorula toruloides]